MQPALILICGGQRIKLLLRGWMVAAQVMLNAPAVELLQLLMYV